MSQMKCNKEEQLICGQKGALLVMEVERRMMMFEMKEETRSKNTDGGKIKNEK